MTITEPTTATLTDLLGPPSGRYFGRGYRAVTRALTATTFDEVSETFSATGELVYPASWSIKSSGTLVPHLSSIDTLTLAVAATCDALLSAYRLDPADLDAAWLRDIRIVAGAQPDEDLARVSVSVRLHPGLAPDDGETPYIAADFAVGSLRGRLGLCLPYLPGPRTGARPVSSGDPTRLYHHTFADHRVDAEDLCIASDCTSIRGRARVSVELPVRSAHGLESAFGPTVSFVDGLVGAAQLAQILLYRLDDVDRSRSNTLWMRKLHLTANTPVRPIAEPLSAEMSVRRVSEVRMAGARWRSADLTLNDFGGISGGCLLAHALPESMPAR